MIKVKCPNCDAAIMSLVGERHEEGAVKKGKIVAVRCQSVFDTNIFEYACPDCGLVLTHLPDVAKLILRDGGATTTNASVINPEHVPGFGKDWDNVISEYKVSINASGDFVEEYVTSVPVIY